MSSYARTFRLEADSAKVGEAALDQITGAAMAAYRGTDTEFQIALFMAGKLVPKANITSVTVSLVNNSGTALVTWTNSGSGLNDALTVGAWRRGSDHMTAVVLNATDSTALTAGAYRLVVTAVLNSVPAGGSGTVVFANAAVDLANPPAGTLPSSPPTPGPPTSYTKAEDDARFAPLAVATTVGTHTTDITALNAFVEKDGTTPKFVRAGASQSLTTGEQLQARTNIDAEIRAATATASLAAAASHVPTPKSIRRFVITLTGDATFANAATFADWIPGQIYEILIIQDATGGRVLTWGNSYIFPTFAAVNPEPSSTTRLFARSDGTNVRVWEAEPVAAPRPDLFLSAACGLTHNATPDVTAWSERARGITLTLFGSPAIAYTDINGRPAGGFLGTHSLRWTGLTKAFATGGVTVAAAFDSRGGGSPQMLVQSPGLGIEVGYNSSSGLYISAIGASSGNRVALPFTPNAATPAIFVGTIRGSGAGGGIAIDQGGATTYVAGGAMTTPAVAGTEIVMGSWIGRMNQVAMFMRALSWPEMLAVRRQLHLELGI